MTIGEVYDEAFGQPDPATRLDAFREFLRPFRILDLNEPTMERFARIRSDLRRRGQLISDFDILLAATALHYDLIVLTYNVRHLQRIPGLKIYQTG